ncbi:hypothetical protein KUTeg_005258, partial [Tegillarca granosa]
MNTSATMFWTVVFPWTVSCIDFIRKCNSFFFGFKRWENFITGHGHCALPAEPIYVSLHLKHLINQGSSNHPVQNAVYSIKWAHNVNGLPDPTSNSFVSSLLKASKRVSSHKIIKKDPVSTETLIICDIRYDELTCLLYVDVQVKHDYLILNISKSKTDQFRHGHEVLISNGNTVACPYEMYLRYIR